MWTIANGGDYVLEENSRKDLLDEILFKKFNKWKFLWQGPFKFVRVQDSSIVKAKENC